MSLSSINFSSYQNSIAAAYTPTRSSAKVTPITATTAQPQGTSVATALGTLLSSLAAQDLSGSRQSLATLTTALRSTNDETGQFTRLLTRVSASLDTGETTPALAQIQQYLLASGRTTGTTFSATA